MGLRISGSKLSLALKCGFPFRADVDVAPEPEVGRAAKTGVGFALFREFAVEGARFQGRPDLSKQAVLDVLHEGGRSRAARLMDRWIEWWTGYSAKYPGMRWESEIPFAFDPITGKARRLKVSDHRAYEGAKPHEIVATADMLGTSATEIVVHDEKTGMREYVTPAKDNPQLSFLSLCHSLVSGIRFGRVGLVFPHLEDPLDEAIIDGISIDAAKRKFMELPAKVASSGPVIGDWCTFCPHRAACPAWKATDELVAETRRPRSSRGAVSSPSMARIRVGQRGSAGMAEQLREENAAVARNTAEAAGTVCEQCGSPQYKSPSGLYCDNGHGGAGSLTREEWVARASAAAIESFTGEDVFTPAARRRVVRPETPEDNAFAPARGLPPRGAPLLQERFEKIVDRIYRSDDAAADYERLEQQLSLPVVGPGLAKADFAYALNESESNALRSYALYLAAVLERTQWESEAELIMAPIRMSAIEALSKEKRDKLRAKDITDSDVRAKMALMHPDEFKWFEVEGVKVKALEKQLLRLADLWEGRSGSLRSILESYRQIPMQ